MRVLNGDLICLSCRDRYRWSLCPISDSNEHHSSPRVVVRVEGGARLCWWDVLTENINSSPTRYVELIATNGLIHLTDEFLSCSPPKSIERSKSFLIPDERQDLAVVPIATAVGTSVAGDWRRRQSEEVPAKPSLT